MVCSHTKVGSAASNDAPAGLRKLPPLRGSFRLDRARRDSRPIREGPSERVHRRAK